MASKKIYVFIKGPVSAMKTPMANLIKDAINNCKPNLSCTVFDHLLFTFHKSYEQTLKQAKLDASASSHDVCVFVVGTGTGDEPLQIDVYPAIYGTRVIFNAVIDYLSVPQKIRRQL
jgi:hypothetical protein